MRLPGLPVSRRRHEADIDFIVELMQALLEHERDEARSERDAALSRVVELEQAIRSHRDHEFPDGEYDAVQRFEQAMAVNRKLWSVLDGHDRQERGDGHVAQHPVRKESCCYVCGSSAWKSGQRIYLGGEEHWRHADCQPPKAADVLPPREGRNDPPNVWSQGIPAGQHDLAGQPCATCGAPLRSEGSVARFNTQTRWSHKPCLDGVARREREGGRR